MKFFLLKITELVTRFRDPQAVFDFMDEIFVQRKFTNVHKDNVISQRSVVSKIPIFPLHFVYSQ